MHFFLFCLEKLREEGGRILCYLKPVGCALSLLVLVVNERQSPTFDTLCGLLIKCDTVREYTFISVEIKSVSETFIS